MTHDRRTSRREPLALVVTLADGTRAVTRDVSPDGLYFLMPSDQRLARWLRLEYEMPRAGLKFCAVGEVVRVEPGPDHTGVALRLHATRLLSLD